MRLFKQGLIIIHRYLGIVLSLMFIVWFASAFVMIYAGGMPRITPQMRIEGAAAVDLDAVRFRPEEAAGVLGYSPQTVTLRSFLNRPVFDFTYPGYPAELVFADTGEQFQSLSPEQGAQLAADFLGIPASEFSFDTLVTDVDQWTLTLRDQVPFYKYSVADGSGTQVYVSINSAQVSVYTTQQSRALAWIGTIPHWLYFKSLRLNQPFWYDLVVWLSGLGCVLAGAGLILGIVQWRKTRPFQLKKAIPYRGLMRWHYLIGITFGIVSLTWVFSGLLSMEPFGWTSRTGLAVDDQVYQQGEPGLADFPALDSQQINALVPGVVKEVQYQWIMGAPYLNVNYSAENHSGTVKRERLHQPYYIQGQADADSILIDPRSGRVQKGFATETLVSLLENSTEATVIQADLLDEYDDYYYSRAGQIPLPVLRMKFDDPAKSWIYVDPANARLLSLIHKYSRVERWLYNGLHSLDFAFWYHKRPLWDLGMIILLTGGLFGSCLGFYIGVRRAKRDLAGLFSRKEKITTSEVPGVP